MVTNTTDAIRRVECKECGAYCSLGTHPEFGLCPDCVDEKAAAGELRS